MRTLIMAKLRKKDIQQILKLFEDELNLLIRQDKLEKMRIRKEIKDAVMPMAMLDIREAKIFMDIVEEKLHDVLDQFLDGYEFRKKLHREVAEILKADQI